LGSVLLTRVDYRSWIFERSGVWDVEDARYFRSQAELYLQLARQMSLRVDAQYCRVCAGRYAARAAELEAGEPNSSTPADASSEKMDAGHAAASVAVACDRS